MIPIPFLTMVALYQKISSSDNLEGSTRLGFIVRKNEWEEKDIDNDRFIDITETTEDGILHVYLVEGDSSIGYSIDDPDGPSRFPKI